MPIKSFGDIDNMIANWRNSQNQSKSYSTVNEGTYDFWSAPSSPTSPSSHSSNMSRNVRVIGVRDVLDGNGYFNSSRQVIK